MFWKAARDSVLLSLLFMGAYGTCNYLASQRADVGTWYYAWERFIPFVPLFVIPYMSIDLFFFAAPFLCSGDQERRTLAGRITLAILIASVFFLVMPLKLAVPRPVAGGWAGALLSQFQTMDQPYNLLPSLHITLRTILADTYARHTRGLLRWATIIWFSLIGLSTILVYQHHIVDVVGGFLLAGLCFYFVRPGPWRLPFTPNARIAACYVLGASILLACAFALQPWGMWLIWPSLSLAIVTAGYLWLGPAFYAKRDGVLPLATRLVHFPMLLGQQWSLRHYAQQCRKWDALTKSVWIGRVLNVDEAMKARRDGVVAVLDLTSEFSETKAFREIAYLNLPILDLTAPTPLQIDEALAFMRRHIPSGVVYVHCKIGYSRTAVIAATYLLHTGECSNADEAIATLRRTRPSIVIRREAEAAIRQHAARLIPAPAHQPTN